MSLNLVFSGYSAGVQPPSFPCTIKVHRRFWLKMTGKTILGSNCPRELQNLSSQCIYFHKHFLSVNPTLPLKCNFIIQIPCILNVFLPFSHYPPISLFISCLTQGNMLESIVLLIVIKTNLLDTDFMQSKLTIPNCFKG